MLYFFIIGDEAAKRLRWDSVRGEDAGRFVVLTRDAIVSMAYIHDRNFFP